MEYSTTSHLESALPNRWLMDLSQPMAIFTVIVITQMVVLVYSLSFFKPNLAYLNTLAVISLVAQLMAISLIVMLVKFRDQLNQLTATTGTLLVLLMTTLLATLFVGFVIWVDAALMFNYVEDGALTIVKVLLATLMTMLLLLRYFYVQNLWQQQVKALAAAQMNAFQARIKPHFLYNSLNSIASLISIDPPAAEQAVMDLSGLFRKAFTQRHENMTSLSKELAWVNQYLAIEKLRLAERLQTDIQVEPTLLEQSIPMLSIQPLIENAVIHGIAHLPDGGCIRLHIQRRDDFMQVLVSNPLLADKVSSGSGTALDNIRSRLALHYGSRAQLKAKQQAEQFIVTMELPL